MSPLRRRVKNARRRVSASEPASEAAALRAVEPVKRVRIPEAIANWIRLSILDGTLAPERPLPSERTLAKRLGVSRGSVRDGIRRLEVIGLLVTRHGQGTFPRELSVDNLVKPLASVLTFNHARQENLLDVRRIFEPAVARVAATRITDRELAELDAITAAQRRKVRAGQSTIGEDTAFHAALARATHNPVLVRLMETLNDLLVESRTRTLRRRGRPLRSLRGHEQVLLAVRRRDADGAALAMSEHIDQIAALLRQAMTGAAPRE